MMRVMENSFIVACIVLLCYMATKETLRYFKNNDISTISFRNFATTSKDTYPTFSLCLTSWQSGDELYSFFRNEIASAMPFSHQDFARILKGEKINTGVAHELNESQVFDFRNLSEANVNNFTITLKSLYHSVDFTAKNPNDTIFMWNSFSEDRHLPFYVSYQDPENICFTRETDKRKTVTRVKDSFAILLQQLYKMYGHNTVKIFIHHPGQLLRVYDSPIMKLQIIQTQYLWAEQMTEMIFKISQVSILRKRKDATSPCNDSLIDDDLQIRNKVSEEVGCIPVYWKNLKLMQYKYETCKTSQDMEMIWEKLQNIFHIQSTYQPPCNEMKLTASHEKQTHYRDRLSFTFQYMEKSYQEIINEREFGFESLWSTVGGFIGMFVGTSLSEVPSFIISAWNRMQSLKK